MKERDRHTERDRERETQRDRERHRKRDRETDTEREKDTERDREREKEISQDPSGTCVFLAGATLKGIFLESLQCYAGGAQKFFWGGLRLI